MKTNIHLSAPTGNQSFNQQWEEDFASSLGIKVQHKNQHEFLSKIIDFGLFAEQNLCTFQN